MYMTGVIHSNKFNNAIFQDINKLKIFEVIRGVQTAYNLNGEQNFFNN